MKRAVLIFIFCFLPLSVFSTDNDRKFANAWILIEKEKYAAALKLFEEIIQTDGRHGEAFRDAGWLLYDKFKKAREAIVYLEKAEKIIPGDIFLAVYAGQAHYMLGNYTQAVSYYRKCVSLYADASKKPKEWILNGIAEIYLFKLNPPEYDLGIEYATLSLANKPSPALTRQAWGFLSWAYYKKDNLEKARECAKNADSGFWIARWLAPRTLVMNFDFDFSTLMSRHFSHLKPGIIRINMPMNTYYQRFIALESVPAYTRIEKVGRENFAIFDFSKGFPGTLRLSIRLSNQVVQHKPENLRAFTTENNEAGYFANTVKTQDHYFPIEYDIANAAVREKVAEITKNDTTLKDKVLSLYRWMGANINHDNNIAEFKDKPSTDYNKISEILLSRHGFCTQISALFVGMCRVLKVPARIVSGLQTQPDLDKNQGVIIGHDTVEIFDADRNEWVYIEPQGYAGFGANFWGHIVFRTETVEPRPDVIDIMKLWRITSDLGFKERMTYRITQN